MTAISATSLRFSFDLGTQSIGWAVFTLNDDGSSPRANGLIDCGVRIFDDSRDPQSERPLGERRRGPRSMRRRRDRFLQRRQRVMQMLMGFGLLPTDVDARRGLASLDPYRLRAEALDRALLPYELGRALVHLNQRRGFKSNRKTDSGDTDEKGKIASANQKLLDSLKADNARTFGEFLWRRHGGTDGKARPRDRQPVRIRLEGAGREALYEFYPTRAMLESEFDAIMAAQRAHHPRLLTDDRIALLRQEIFFQRPLKSPQRGKCTFVPSEERLYRALPSVEARVIYQAVNELRFGVSIKVDTKPDAAQRNAIVAQLLKGKAVTLNQLRRSPGAPADARSAIAAGEVEGLKDYVSETAKKMGAKDTWGPSWHDLALDTKDAVVSRLLGDEDDDTIHTWLMEEHGLSKDRARKVASLSFKPGTAHLGRTANAAVLAELMADDVPTYSKAVARAGYRRGEKWHHSNLEDPKWRKYLPYYAQVLDRYVLPGSHAPGDDPLEAQYGRIANPTVHRGLRQIQKLVNALIRKHGRPRQVVIEVARDLKLNEQQKAEHRKANEKNRKDNETRRKDLETLGVQITTDALLRLRLFDEQAAAGEGVALCPYSLRPIAREDVLSDRIEVDHILPYSRTLDDSPANKILCWREANRDKGRRCPHAWLHDREDWPKIEANAKRLPLNKRWRFAENAMERFENEERDFTERQLNETRYISRLARAYLTVVAGKGKVYVTTGQLTAMLRRRWGLNAILRGDNQPEDEPARKVRDDHRHHAIDAIVVGAIDRPLLNEMARRAGEFEGEGRDWRITDAAPEEPFLGYADKAKQLVRNIIVSRKPDHGKGGALHEETAYGIITDEDEAKLIGNLVTRKPITALTANEVDRVRDPVLRKQLQDAVASFRDDRGRVSNKKAFETALKEFSSKRDVQGRMQGVRRVRIGKSEKDFIAIKDRRSGEVYKALIAGENHHIDIVQMRDGSWRGFAATRFEVNQPGWRPQWEREKLGGKLVMRLHKGDIIAIKENGRTRYMTVHRLSPSNNLLYLAEHFEGGALQTRHKDKADLFCWDFANIGKLKAREARLVHVDILGQVIKKRSNID